MLTRRGALGLLLTSVCIPVIGEPSMSQALASQQAFATGADLLVASGFAALAGKRVGLITNQTGLVGGEHLADLLSKAPGLKLAAIFAPEHGFRGKAEAGASVRGGVDAKTGVPIFSLYGATRKPTQVMLRNVDVLVFDIQDVGARFYTYISTMGLAMQAAAAARIPFVVLDRPNPLGGEYVSGFVLEPSLRSFVGQYPIPIVHGLTVGELARMIKGEGWLEGLGALELSVVEMQGWRRSMRWPQTERAWVATSPNIPTFESALVYPGIGIVGEAEVSEGRGTPTPFSLFAAPWLDAARTAAQAECARPPRRDVSEGDLHAALDPRRRRAPAFRGHEPRWRAGDGYGRRARRAARDRHARAGRDRSRGPVQGRHAAVRQPQDAARHRRHATPAAHARQRQRRQRHHRRLAVRGGAIQSHAWAVSDLLSSKAPHSRRSQRLRMPRTVASRSHAACRLALGDGAHQLLPAPRR